MGFFAGRIGTKTVLSLNSVAGGDINQHNVPNANTIFHSDMPHLFVKQKFLVNLASDGEGYFIGTLPTELRTLLANRANVIIPVMVAKNAGGTEFFHQMTGINKCATYSWVVGGGGISIAGTYGGSVHFDLNVEWGYYRAASGVATSDRIATDGTGGYHMMCVESGEDYVPADAYEYATCSVPTITTGARVRPPARNYLPRAASPIYTNISADEKNNLINPDYMNPMGPSSSTYDTVFVRAGGSRNMTTWKSISTTNLANTKQQDIAFFSSDPLGIDSDSLIGVHRRASLERAIKNGQINGQVEATFAGMTPVRMEFLVLNVSFNNTGGYTAQNLFTGAEIKISETDFTIKGINLRSTSYEMLAAVSTGVPSISTSYFASNCQVAAATTLADGGAFRFYGTTAAGASGSWAATGVDGSVGTGTQWNIGLYKFPANSSVIIDSRTPKVSLNNVDVWSPSIRPLQLFTANKANNVMIGDNEYLRAIATGGTLMLNSVGAGLPAAGTTTILLSIEWMSNDLCSSMGDVSMGYIFNDMVGGTISIPGYHSSVPPGKRLTKFDYDSGDGVSHQIVVLNPNVYVPILVENAYSFSGAGSTGGGKPKSRFQYYIRKNGSTGNVEFWACSRATGITVNGKPAPVAPYVQFPRLRLNVQRLT